MTEQAKRLRRNLRAAGFNRHQVRVWTETKRYTDRGTRCTEYGNAAGRIRNKARSIAEIDALVVAGVQVDVHVWDHRGRQNTVLLFVNEVHSDRKATARLHYHRGQR
jgi:hypothetical protein